MSSIDNSIPGGEGRMSMQLLFVGRNLNMQSASDQEMARVFGGTNAMATLVIAVQKSGAGSVTCAGGVYTALSKGGSALVSAVQSWVTLASGVQVTAVMAGVAQTALTGPELFLSLTTGSTGALTADMFVFGVVLD